MNPSNNAVLDPVHRRDGEDSDFDIKTMHENEWEPEPSAILPSGVPSGVIFIILWFFCDVLYDIYDVFFMFYDVMRDLFLYFVM